MLFVGDSITQGDQAGGQGSGKTYPEQAIAHLNDASGGKFAFAVRAYPGKPGHWFLTHRLTGVLDSIDAKGYKRKIATQFFGANDIVYPEKGSSLEPDSVWQYNAAITDSLRKRGYEVIICPMMNITYQGPEFAPFNQRRLAYNVLVEQHRKDYLGVVSLQNQPLLYAPDAPSNKKYFVDRIHPNAEGAALLGLEFARTIGQATGVTLSK